MNKVIQFPKKPKNKSVARVLFEEVLRIALGFSIILGSLMLAYACEESKANVRHAKFNQCLEKGMKPMLCSFEIAFKVVK